MNFICPYIGRGGSLKPPRAIGSIVPTTPFRGRFARRDHALAPIAQIRMRLAGADGWPMATATCTFFIRRFRHRNSRFHRLLEQQCNYVEYVVQLFLLVPP